MAPYILIARCVPSTLVLSLQDNGGLLFEMPMPEPLVPREITPAAVPKPAPLSVLTLTAPVAMGYIPLGTVFGFLFVQAGGEGWLAVLASVLVYAGAAQYMMIPMLAAGLPVTAIALATFIVNLRHVFYGLSLLDKLPKAPLLRSYCVFGLTDETYSVLTTMPVDTSPRQMALVSLLNSAAVRCGIEPAAGEAKLARSGLALAQARKSLMVLTLAGTAGPTPKPWLKKQATETGARSSSV